MVNQPIKHLLRFRLSVKQQNTNLTFPIDFQSEQTRFSLLNWDILSLYCMKLELKTVCKCSEGQLSLGSKPQTKDTINQHK